MSASLRSRTKVALLVSLLMYTFSIVMGGFGTSDAAKKSDNGVEDTDMNMAMQAMLMLAFVLLAIATMIAISLNEGVKEEHGDFSNLGYMVIGVMTFLAIGFGVAGAGMAGSVTNSNNTTEKHAYIYSTLVISLMFAMMAMVTSIMLGCPNILQMHNDVNRREDIRRDPYIKAPPPGSYQRGRGPPRPGMYGGYP